MGVVNGPGSSVVGNVVLWNDTTGTTVSDSGAPLLPSFFNDANESVAVGTGTGAAVNDSNNTAVGYKALNATGGVGNTAVGRVAGWVINGGDNNTIIGSNGATNLTTGNSNTTLGKSAGTAITTGSSNILIGDSIDVPSGSTSNYLNIGGVITATGMNTPSTSTVTVPGALIVQGAISGFLTTFNNQTGTTYTLASTDSGTTVTLNNAGAITVTLPNSLSAGFTCECIQLGAGQVTFSAATGATLKNRQSFTKIAGQNGAVRLVVTGNSGGTSAVYNLAGDCA